MENETIEQGERFAHSENIADLAASLAKAQGAMEAAIKDSVNPHFRSKYADLASIWEAVRRPLSDNGIAVVQLVSSPAADVVTVTTMLAHASGQWMRSSLSLTAVGSTPQNLGSAITYGKRYGLAAMVGIAPDDDDDGNRASGGGYGQREAPGAEYRQAPEGVDVEAVVSEWREQIAGAADASTLKRIGGQLARQPQVIQNACREAYGARQKALAPNGGR
jgi:hypothetical protein